MALLQNTFKEKAASIIIRTYNNEATIEDALMSALNQNFPATDYEVVVINDGSSDGTDNLIAQFRRKDSRIVYVYRNHEGAVAAANRGIEASVGRFITFLDSDDSFEPNYLSVMLQAAAEHPEYNFYYSAYWEQIGTIKNMMKPKNIYETIMVGNLYKKEKLIDVGKFREDLLFPEYDLLLRTRKIWKGYYVPSPLFIYRRRRGSLTSNPLWAKRAIVELAELHPDAKTEIKLIRGYGF